MASEVVLAPIHLKGRMTIGVHCIDEKHKFFSRAVDADGAATARAKEAVTATCTDLPLTWDSEPMACRESR